MYSGPLAFRYCSNLVIFYLNSARMMSVGVTCPHPSHTLKMVGLVNGSIRHQDKPLRITVVGAGIAGLACAVALRRQGHVVEVTVGNFRTSLVALTAFFALHYRFM